MRIIPPLNGSNTRSDVKIYGEENGPAQNYSGFVSENAGYFAQMFAPLNEVFKNEGPMKIVSEERDYTVVVAVRLAEGAGSLGEGVMDVDCAIIKQKPKSLRASLKSLD